MTATIDVMSEKRQTRMVRIPEPMAKALEGMAEEKFTTLAEMLRVAVADFLEKNGRMPKPAKPRK